MEPMTSRVMLLGLPIDPVTEDQAIELLYDFLEGEGQHHVMTPNNEMLVEATRNQPFAGVIRAASLNLPDSSGLLWAAKWTGQSIPERVTGVDTVECLCGELDAATPVFLLGAAPGVADKAAAVLREDNPQLVVCGTHAGSPSDADAEAIIEKIRASQAKLLLVAFGAPAQDLWIAKHLSRLPSVRVAMGVGGTFDFLAGVQKRAPAWMRSLHLEWFWRLLRQPSRIGRILNAVVVFPLLVLRRGRG